MPITVNSDPVDEVIVSCGGRGQSFHIFMLPLCAFVHSDTHTHTHGCCHINQSYVKTSSHNTSLAFYTSTLVHTSSVLVCTALHGPQPCEVVPEWLQVCGGPEGPWPLGLNRPSIASNVPDNSK